MDKKYEILKEKLDKSQNIAIFGHNFIDGDCLGSCIGLGNVLKKLGKKVSFFTAQDPEKTLRFVKGVNDFKTQFNYKIKYDLIIFMDTANPLTLNDIWAANPEYFVDKEIVNIDHHISNTEYAELNIVRPDFSSNCEHILFIIEKFYKELIDAEIATALMTGLITDTGNFFHSNTTSDTFENASKLQKYGADRELIIEKIFRSNELISLDLTKIILNNLKIYKNTIYSYIDIEEITSLGLEYRHKEIAYSMICNIKGFKNYVMLTKLGAQIKGSIKNKNNLSDKISSIFGGGGHPGRSGFKVNIAGNIDEEINNIILKIANFQE